MSEYQNTQSDRTNVGTLPANNADDCFNFRLYVAGQTPKSLAAITNLKTLCEKHLPESHTIEIIDIAKNPELAIADQILALPTLVRRIPEPIKRMIGTLSDLEKVLVGLDIERKE